MACCEGCKHGEKCEGGQTYVDRRTGETRAVPNCAKVSLAWSAELQRCVRPSLLDWLKSLMACHGCEQSNGLGFMDDGDFPSEVWGGDWNFPVDPYMNGGGDYGGGGGDWFPYSDSGSDPWAGWPTGDGGGGPVELPTGRYYDFPLAPYDPYGGYVDPSGAETISVGPAWAPLPYTPDFGDVPEAPAPSYYYPGTSPELPPADWWNAPLDLTTPPMFGGPIPGGFPSVPTAPRPPCPPPQVRNPLTGKCGPAPTRAQQQQQAGKPGAGGAQKPKQPTCQKPLVMNPQSQRCECPGFRDAQGRLIPQILDPRTNQCRPIQSGETPTSVAPTLVEEEEFPWLWILVAGLGGIVIANMMQKKG